MILPPHSLKPKLAMNRANLSLLIILSISIAIAFTWTNPFDTAIAQTENSFPVARLKAEQLGATSDLSP